MIRINRQDRVFILTGAGISAESGIPTFRDSDGLWHQYRVEDVATPEAFDTHPELVWRFYSARRRGVAECKPNAAHSALAELEAKLGDRFTLCTQNIDPLHERAGSKRVLHMHGELFKTRCEGCSRPPFHDDALHDNGTVPRCSCGGRLRPHVCWFGELPYELETIIDALEHASVFVTIGSSGQVQPAASFALWAGRSAYGARAYYVGPEEPDNVWLFDECFLGNAGEVVPRIFGIAGQPEN